MPPEGPSFQTTHPSAPESLGASLVLEATVVHPPEVAGARFTLGPHVVFGRAPEEATACIPHPTISRRHARILIGLGGVLCIEDLGSRNGVRVDGKRPEIPLPLSLQTVIRLGDVHLVVDARSERRFEDDPVLLGASPLMARARAELEQAARDDAPVLVVGETGTGKEHVARELHRASGRQGAYVTLNAAELTPQLVESQLFGHERGAFTGASAARPGLFAAADRGTLFLDEIGELPLELQPKLLRVLQEGEVRRVGSVNLERVDVRVVAATHRDLPELVETGAFRRDLFARLSFHEIRLPALRERRQDLLSWLELLWNARRRETGATVALTLAPDAVERVLLHPWPDNLRGLDRLVHRASGTGGSSLGLRALVELLPELGPRPNTQHPDVRASDNAPPQASRQPTPVPPAPSAEELLRVYEATGRSVRGTAKHFGKDRRQIYRWLERHGIARAGDDGDA